MFLKFLFIFIFMFSLTANSCEKPTMPSSTEWNKWLGDVRVEALKNGISNKTISKYLIDVMPQEKIILRDRCQPESTITLKEYLFYRVDKARIVAGKNMLKEHSELLNKIGSHFGIQPRFIVAVLGMESFYGRNQGKIDTIIAVTTLAFDRRRSSFYRKQLFAALKILDDNLVPSGQLIGSWGGAVGMTQMIPTTFLESAYDWDGNGIDIWNSYADAFASTANYLTSINKNPWLTNSTWGREVLPPKNIKKIYPSFAQIAPKGCGAVKSRSIPKTLSEWSNLGFMTSNNTQLPQRSDLEARLIAPDGAGASMFLVYPNYKNILYYNCSSYYAISIGLLSDKISN
jgi:membrane-bound lytic murein transglycosylase B